MVIVIVTWGCILYSDETLIELGEHGPVWVQRPVGTAFDPEYMSHKEPHPERVCVWACFSRSGVGDIHIFTENLDAVRNESYLSITSYSISSSFIP